jgi:hypothetical protein
MQTVEPSDLSPPQIEGEVENLSASLLTTIRKSAVKIYALQATLKTHSWLATGPLKMVPVTFTGCKIYLNEVENTSCIPYSKKSRVL